MITIDNPIGWAQFHLLGGWRNLIVTSGAYALVLSAVMFGVVLEVHGPTHQIYASFSWLFLVLQLLTLLLYGLARVAMAARSDVRTRIIESHRLMPAGAMGAVVGYWLGAPLQALIVFLINLALGAIAFAEAGLSVDSWLMANAILLAFSLFVWAVVLFFSFRTGLALWATLVIFLLVPMSGMQLLDAVPGMSVLAYPLVGVFQAYRGMNLELPYAMALGIEAVITAIYLFAATRRYESDHAIGIGPRLGLLLLVAWVAACCIGMRAWSDFRVIRWRMSPPQRDLILTDSFGIAMLLAILPVSSAVREFDKATGRPGNRKAWPIWTVIAATVITWYLLLGIVERGMRWDFRIPRTALVILAFLCLVRYTLGVVHHSRFRPRAIMLGVLLLTWCIPVFINTVLAAMSDDPDHWHLSQFAMCSPIVELYQIWSRSRYVHSDRFGGLIFQCVLAAAAAIIYHSGFRGKAVAWGRIKQPKVEAIADSASPAATMPSCPATPK